MEVVKCREVGDVGGVSAVWVWCEWCTDVVLEVASLQEREANSRGWVDQPRLREVREVCCESDPYGAMSLVLRLLGGEWRCMCRGEWWRC